MAHYELGKHAAALVLPRRGMGEQVAVGPYARHENYLRDRNSGSHSERFKDGEIARFESEHGTQILTVPSSGYVEGPHGMHVMLVAVGKDKTGRERTLPTFSHFNSKQGAEHFGILSQIAGELTNEYKDSWFIGTSVSPHEWKRQAVQSVKTVHTHIIGFGKEAVEGAVALDEIRGKERQEKKRMLADTFSPLATDMLRHMVFTPEFFVDPTIKGIVAEQDVRLEQEYPKGYILTLNGGSEALADPRTFALVSKIDTEIARAYNDVFGRFAQRTRRDIFDRPALLPQEERDKRIASLIERNQLPSHVANRLRHISQLIKPSREILGRAQSYDEETYLANTRLMLNGYAYNIVFFPCKERPGKLAIGIVPRLLSGGSPLDAMGIYKEQFSAPDAYIDKAITRQKLRAGEIVARALQAEGEQEVA